MKRILSIVTIYVLMSGIASAVTDEKDFEQFSERFLAAIQNEYMQEFMACWVSVEQMKEFFASMPTENRPPAEQMDEIINYTLERDKFLKDYFPKLISVLSENNIDTKELKYFASDGVVRSRGGFEKAGNIDMVFEQENGTTIKFSVDDGAKMDGKWYFSDRPMKSIHIYIEGRSSTLFVK